MAGVSISKVVKTFGKVDVIHGIDLEVKDGEFVVLVGPSGCGKSTLLRMIAGLESVSAGEIKIGPRVVNDLPPRERDVAMVFQDYALYPHKTVYENMAFGLRMRNTPPQEIKTRVNEAAEMLQIAHLFERRPGQLSGGQRQRVAMGRSIVRRPQVFLFDEPLSNLDAQLRGEVRIEIKKLHQRFGTTIVYVTHDQVEAMTLADRIAVLRGGNLEQFASPEEIYNRPASRFVAGFMGSPPMSFVDAVLSDNGSQLELAGGITFSLAPGHRPTVIGNGHKVVAGFRPEHVVPDLAGAQDSRTIEARIELLEPLGAETLAMLSIGPNHITGRFPPDPRWRVGQQVQIALHPNKIHLFDPASGVALRRH